eukprot:TRINITY_DN21129_c0_g1_i1.p1 TRINITY_DN21129_c0_g1~~TRINITY_DN21129_c0_g1_i1.p1  ORF type:complete len:562 (+),score=177.97 TRINITY_DN21129_c0_g1_i1:89-1687(+)
MSSKHVRRRPPASEDDFDDDSSGPQGSADTGSPEADSSSEAPPSKGPAPGSRKRPRDDGGPQADNGFQQRGPLRGSATHGVAEQAHPSGLWVAPDLASPEDCRQLMKLLAVGLEQRGQRMLRWYGANWLGRGDLLPTDPIPSEAKAIVDRICAKVDFPSANVATLHVYDRRRAKETSAGDLGSRFEGRRMAIVPHTDDHQLEGNGGVLMVQLSGSAELVLSRGGRAVAAAKRTLGCGVVCDADAFRSPYQHTVLWPEKSGDREMCTLTLRALPRLPTAAGQGYGEPKRRRVRSPSPPPVKKSPEELRREEFQAKQKRYADWKQRYTETFGEKPTAATLREPKWKHIADMYRSLLQLQKEVKEDERKAAEGGGEQKGKRTDGGGGAVRRQAGGEAEPNGTAAAAAPPSRDSPAAGAAAAAPAEPAEAGADSAARQAEYDEGVTRYNAWRKDFREQHGRVPVGPDLAGNAEISVLYNRLKVLRAQGARAKPPASVDAASRPRTVAEAVAAQAQAAGEPNPFLSAPSAPKRPRVD